MSLVNIAFGLIESIVRKLRAPKLSIEFRPSDPRFGSLSNSRNIQTGEITASSHTLRLRVNNDGRDGAEETQVHLKQLERWDDTQFVIEPGFVPIRLPWSSRINRQPGTQIPGQSHRYCDFGLIIEPGKTVRGRVSDDNQRPVFWFDTEELPSKGIAGLLPGLYRITLGTTATNAKPTTAVFLLDWIGGWSDRTEQMVSEFIVCSQAEP